MRKYRMFWNRCNDCGHEFETVGGRDDYETRLLLSKDQHLPALIWCDTDPVFREVYTIVETFLHTQGLSLPIIVRVFNEIFGEICDKALDGSPYDMSGKRWCPNCHSSSISYGPTEPPVFKELDLPAVSHKHWDKLSHDEKTTLIIQLIKKSTWFSLGSSNRSIQVSASTFP
jgi:hypothetical protein